MLWTHSSPTYLCSKLNKSISYRDAVTQPLLSSISSLLTQRNSLCSLLRDKDLELEDLRGGGATLSLPKLETKRFALESFLEEQRADTIKDPMDFLINKDVVGIMSMGKGPQSSYWERPSP